MTGADAYAVATRTGASALGEEAEKAAGRNHRGVARRDVTTEVLFWLGGAGDCRIRATNDADLIVMGTHGHGAVLHC